MSGKCVYLVSAGPGEPGCLTLRGRDCLGRADVVIYDYLANPELLAHAPRGAERIFAGKHGAGGPKLLEQSEINQLLIKHAQAGRTVVRLKGGDAFVFGRGGEEAEVLAAHGIPFEVVPGVTAAFGVPAFAGIPVTHRDWVSGVTVLTGHEAPGKEESRLRFQHIARAGNTIVLLMGVTQLRENLAALVHGGLSPTTPAAAIRWGGMPRQQVIVATAGSLADQVAAARLRPPVTVVVGEVVRLREPLSWFERRPLFGKRVLVTRSRAQASAFAALLAEAGAAVIECPAIEIAPPESYAALDRALGQLERYDWLIFTSTNGVEQFFQRLDEKRLDVRVLHRARLAAIGPETARALTRRHLRTDVLPEEYRAEGLLDSLASVELAGARVLLARAAGARAILPEELGRRGARVDAVDTYRSVKPAASLELLRSAIEEGPVDCVTFTSSSTVTNFLALLDEAQADGRAWLADARIACIGPITAATAEQAGLNVELVPSSYTIPAFAEAIVTHFKEKAS